MARSYRPSRLHRRPIRLASGVFGVAVVAALSTLAVAAQDNQFQVFLAVTEAASGKPVVDLKPEDISMSESGMRQPPIARSLSSSSGSTPSADDSSSVPT